jgi:hypothetical protein
MRIGVKDFFIDPAALLLSAAVVSLTSSSGNSIQQGDEVRLYIGVI